jgi:hypothetical protein
MIVVVVVSIVVWIYFENLFDIGVFVLLLFDLMF